MPCRLPFLWGLNDLPGAVAPYSPHRLVSGRDPIGFGDIPPPPPPTVDTGVEDATEYFRKAQGERQLVQTKLTDPCQGVLGVPQKTPISAVSGGR